jgi:prolyl oligopeptidase
MSPAESPSSYPKAERLPLVETLHGVEVADPYRWLEDVDDPRTIVWSQQQDELLDAQRDRWSTSAHWEKRLTELLAAGGITAPIWRGERQFFMRRTADQEMAVLLTVDPDGTERVLIDPMALDANGLTTLDSWQPSKEGHLLAYQLSEGGTEESVVRVMDVATGELVDGPIDRARYSPIAFLPGGEAYYYVRRLAPDLVPDGEEQFHRRVWFHRLGTDPSDDIEIFGDGLTVTNYYGVSVSRDGRWLQISASEGTAPRNDLWIADLTTSSPQSPTLLPVQLDVDAQTGLEFGRDGRMYVFTDLDAPRGRICVGDPSTPTSEHWTDLVPEHEVAVLEGFAILDGPQLDVPELLVNRTEHAVGFIDRHRLDDGTPLGTIDLPGLGTIGGIVERPEGGHEAWFGYTDHTTPTTIHRYDARTSAVDVWATAPGTVVVPTVSTRQEVYTSRDGTEVRMFVISPTAEPDRPRPTVLYGYGGFGVPLTPGFSAGILAWVEAGGVYAIANLRGGGEEGEEWHREGMLGHKQNVFDDLHAGAEHLIARGWTSADQLGISGGSNGGLLVGAGLTQRPDLYRAVVCSAPLLDMVRYEKFGLGATWNVEYGSADDAEQFGWLIAYSPYHHVTNGTTYPATLFTVFDGDTRVDPLHARKLAAALQHATAGALSDRPILIRAEGDVGHGARSLSRTVALSVDTTAFLAHELGLEPPSAG